MNIRNKNNRLKNKELIKKKIEEGSVFQQRRCFAEAEKKYRQVLKLAPNNPDALALLGTIAFEAGKNEDAIKLIGKATSNNPQIPWYHYNLGLAHSHEGDFQEALNSFDRAISIKGNYFEALRASAIMLKMQGKLVETEELILRALRENPEHIDMLLEAGSYYEHIGETEKAIGYYEKALSLDLYNGRIYRHIASVKPYSFEELKALISIYRMKDINIRHKIELGFAIANSLEKLCDYDEAFKYFSESNKLRRSTYNYAIDEERKNFGLIKEVFSRKKTNETPPLAFTKNELHPIFIIGMPRSGTSLVEQILSAHSEVHGAGELEDLGYVVNSACRRAGYPKDVSSFGHSDFLKIGQRYLSKLKWYGGEKKIITDKMPHNFLYVGLIKLSLPDAIIIHCKRDPVDTCWSIFKNYLIEMHPYAHDLKELFQYYKMYEDLMKHWHHVLPGQIYEFKYEELVADTDNQIEKLLSFCGLSNEKRCARFYESKRLVTTASTGQVKKPVYSSAVQFWRNYELQLGSLIDGLKN